jgi:bifunctional oligoribonuclease and PAP phosphatase NrnA
MEIDSQEITKLENALIQAKNTLLLTHRNPDGDALGSMLAFFQALRSAGRSVTSACCDSVPVNFGFLPESEKIITEFDANKFDLVIIFDCGDIHQTGFYETKPELFDGSKTIIKFDHHATGKKFGDIELVYPDFSATSSILTKLFTILEIPISPNIATCLLAGISTDTGSFKHSNTKAQTLRLAAHLLRKGANNSAIVKNVYQNTPIATLKLWGNVLQNLQQTKKGITLAVAQQKDFSAVHAEEEDINGVIDFVNAIPDSKFAILLSEKQGCIKASLRTKNTDIDVAKVASSFGGGGHTEAAGFTIPGRLEKETRWRVVKNG